MQIQTMGRERPSLSFKWLLVLSAMLTAVLFPYGWLADRWGWFAILTNFIFHAEAMHIVGHLLLFTSTGLLGLYLWPGLRRFPLRYILILLGLGLAQEWLQLISFKYHAFSLSELFDLVVDLCGAWLAWKTAPFLFRRPEKLWRPENATLKARRES